MRITEVSLWLFLLGEPIELHRVRADFETEHQAFLDALPRIGDEDATEAFAERLVDRFSRHPFGKVVRSTAGTRAVRRASDAGKAAYSVAYQLLGGIPYRAGMRAMVRAFGISDPELVDEVVKLVRPVRLHTLRETLQECSDSELIEARDDFQRVIDLLAAVITDDVRQWVVANAHLFRGRFKYDAYVGMIGVIFMVRMERIFPNFSSRLTEVLQDVKAGIPDEAGR